MPGLVDLIATAGLATDDPHEGSGLARTGVRPVAAHEWEPLPGSCRPGTVADGLLPAAPPELRCPAMRRRGSGGAGGSAAVQAPGRD